MTTMLLVVRPFAGHSVGDLIVEASEIRAIGDGMHAHDVIRVMAPCATPDKFEEV